MKRGAVKKKDSKLVNLWVPESLLAVLDQGVVIEDSDRAKFIRNAVREKIHRLGLAPAK